MSSSFDLPARYVLVYLAVAVCWVVTSDLLVVRFFPDDQAAFWPQFAKGIGFVLVTAAALYWLLVRARRREMRARRRAEVMRLLGELGDGVLQDRPLPRLLQAFAEGLRLQFGLQRVLILERSESGRLLPLAVEAPNEAAASEGEPPVPPTPVDLLALLDSARSAEAFLDPRILEQLPEPSLGLEQPPARRSARTRVLAFPLSCGEWRRGVVLLIGDEKAGWTDARRLVREAARSVQVVWETASSRPRLAVQERALRAAANAMVITDAQGRVEWVNPAFERLTGHALTAIRGRSLSFLRSGAHPDSYYERLWQTLRDGRTFEGEFVNRRRDGGLVTVTQTITPVRGAEGTITHFLSIQEDVTERKEAQARLDYLARHDALTGLPNRAAFSEALQVAIGAAERLAVLVVDLDRFQNLNDMMGYETGDRVLREVVARLREETEPGDHLARLGSDEFVLLRSGAGRSGELSALAERLLISLARPIPVAGRELQISASVGISVHPDDALVGGDLLKNAEMAQRRCKREGGRGFRFFSSTIDEAARANVEMEQELRDALGSEQIELHYQPLVDLHGGAVIGAEALLRWRHPRHGLLGPDRFIALAEDTGLILPLGDWVLRKAAEQARAWDAEGLPPLRVGVNLSFAQVAGEKLPERISEVLRETGLPPERLELELTETLLARDMELAVETCDRLRALGVRLAIDDFGIGYSSLSHLRRFAVDHLKIDRSFIADLDADEGQAIVRATIGMAHALGCKLIAEGVESEAQRAFLVGLGCEEAQGYLFARPMPPEDFAVFLRGRVAEGARRLPSPAVADAP